MNNFTSLQPRGLTSAFTIFLALSPISACSGYVEEEVDTGEQPIINGTVIATDNLNPGVVAVFQPAGSCSGSLIRKNWILTARHCVTTDGTVNGPIQTASQVQVTRSVNPGVSAPLGSSVGQKIVADSGQDFALVRISNQPITDFQTWAGIPGMVPVSGHKSQ